MIRLKVTKNQGFNLSLADCSKLDKKKNKKTHCQKTFCIFPKKVFLIFREMESSSHRLKKLFIFQEGTFLTRKINFFSKKIFSYILGNGTF